jgi:hypothetical protein|tara:strand:- start:803 stop:1306 length:504 start_codon:yes stop_codon:yes gene_type:complete
MPDLLMHELSHHEHLRTKLLEEFPEADEETLRDTLEGLTNLHEMLGVVIRSQQEDRVLSGGLRTRIGEMQERLKRLEQRLEKKRELASQVMEQARIQKIVESDFTASLRQVPRPLVVSDESAIPCEFWKPQPPKLDRQRIGELLRGDGEVPGAYLGNGGQTLSVRVK